MAQPNPTIQPITGKLNPWLMLLITLSLTMIGFQFVGMFLGLMAAWPLYPGGLETFINALANPVGNPAMRPILLIMQGVASFTGFIVVPWLLLRYVYNSQVQKIGLRKPSLLMALLAFAITLFFMGFNAPIIEWNKNLTLPWPALEETLRGLEDTLARTSEFLTRFDSPLQLLAGLLVIAVIPGIGEELVFRGLVQNHVYRLAGNMHVAIWVGALLFSLFHLQFYGLVPRMLLGALFGYLYWFSGNLVYAMLAHFFNNAFTLIMLYLYHQGQVPVNIEETSVIPWSQVAVATVLTGVLIFVFKKQAANATLGESV